MTTASDSTFPSSLRWPSLRCRFGSLVGLLVLSFSSVHADRPAPTPSRLPPPTLADLAYGGHERQRLDLWLASATAPTPLLLFIHGGGWAGGDKSDLPPTLLREMRARGISVASINYRYSTTHPLPAPVHDAARALQWLRQQAADWKLDPSRCAAYGISAGGTTALWLACHDDLATPTSADPVARQSSRLLAAVALSPQTCLEPEVTTEWLGPEVLRHPMLARAVGAPTLDALRNPLPEWQQRLREFSPLTHLNAGDPPMLLQNPRRDPLPAISAGSAIHHALLGEKFREKAAAVRVTCVLRLQEAPGTTPTPERFLIDHLTSPP